MGGGDFSGCIPGLAVVGAHYQDSALTHHHLVVRRVSSTGFPIDKAELSIKGQES